MTNLIPFSFESHPVRVVVRDGNPWFVAADVCAALDYRHVPHAMRMLDDDEKDVQIVDTLGGKQKATIICEPGLYRLIEKSRKPEAVPFRRWIWHEVLPSIRKTGGYSLKQAAVTLTETEAYNLAGLFQRQG